VKSTGGSLTSIGVYVGEDWWTFLSTYDDHTPILDISVGSMTVALSIAQQKVSTAAVEFARELASQAARFAAEVERLHGGTWTATETVPGRVRRPDDNSGRGGRNGHSCRPRCLPLLAHTERS
jgi:hypothetical protein